MCDPALEDETDDSEPAQPDVDPAGCTALMLVDPPAPCTMPPEVVVEDAVEAPRESTEHIRPRERPAADPPADPLASIFCEICTAGVQIFDDLTGVTGHNRHANLHQFHQEHSLEDLGLLIEYLRDIAYCDAVGGLPFRKRAWINPLTTCDPERVNKYLPIVRCWAAAGKPSPTSGGVLSNPRTAANIESLKRAGQRIMERRAREGRHHD